MKALKIMMAIAFLSGSAVAFAANKAIHQKGKVFSESEISVKKGETLTFVNDDTIMHNVLSTSPGNQFNLGQIKPGHSTPVTFNSAGEVKVICAIHPSMKMLVHVTN